MLIGCAACVAYVAECSGATYGCLHAVLEEGYQVKEPSTLKLFLILFVKIFLLVAITLHEFTPLNPVFGPMQAVIALAIIFVLSIRKRLGHCLSLLTDLIIALDLSTYFIELAPREFEAAKPLLNPGYSLLFLSLILVVFALARLMVEE